MNDLFTPLSHSSWEEITFAPCSYWKDALDRLLSHRLALFGLFLLVFLFFMAILGPFLTPYSYYEIHLELKNQPPSSLFWFGTDELGRDLFSRTWWGARISLTVGISAALIDVIIGVIWGTFSALKGGIIDELMMRASEILYAIPHLLMVILLMIIMGTGMGTIICALTLTGWVNMANIVRGQILQLKSLDFIQAAHALGASSSRIIFVHLIPNTMGPILTTLTLTIPVAIFTESFLSFLGLGIQAPIASWGSMVNDGLSALRYYPWRVFFPACMITLTMLGFNLLGEGLRDVLDPRLRK